MRTASRHAFGGSVLLAALLVGVMPACADVLGVQSINVDEGLGNGAAEGGTIDPAVQACQVAGDCPVGTDAPAGCSDRECIDHHCVYRTLDDDGDGFRSSAACSIDLPGVTVTVGDDCDDADPTLSPAMARACGPKPGDPSPFPGGRPLGECRAGQQACVGGAVGPCTGLIGPTPEVCDGVKDENCDGAIDEGCPCSGSATRACGIAIGTCTQGVQSCVGGTWSGCTGGAGPKPRDCTSKADNDCDGKADSMQCACVVDASQACATTAPGSCSAGKRTCKASADKTTAGYGACVQTVFPGALVCDGGDHDCNGVADTVQDAPVAAPDVGNACVHVFFCPAADRREVCFATNVGYTYFCNAATRRTLGYAKKASSAGTPNPAPPPGYVRFAVNGAGTKLGPYHLPSACCGAGGCSNPSDSADGVFLSTGELGTQLYTRNP